MRSTLKLNWDFQLDPGELDYEKVETEKRQRCQWKSFSIDRTVQKTYHGILPAFQVGCGWPCRRPLTYSKKVYEPDIAYNFLATVGNKEPGSISKSLS